MVLLAGEVKRKVEGIMEEEISGGENQRNVEKK